MTSTLTGLPMITDEIETPQVSTKFSLCGTEELRIDKITTTYKIVRELNRKTREPIGIVSKEAIDESVEPLCFRLIEVSPKEISAYRKKGVPSFILKVDGKLFHTRIPKDVSFMAATILGKHQCAHSGDECNRLSAASYENGGCKKVRNRARFIERYPWITTGYETFHTQQDVFVVVNCLHYEKCPPHENRTISQINTARLSLAQFMWDDVETFEDVRRKSEKNRAYIGMY